jgi:alkylhydroperoxidase/carboxymuconolactone decarboxylase family protein YurZ
MSIYENRGLNLTLLEEMSPAEEVEFRASYGATHGRLPDAYEFWLEFAPPVAKRQRLQAYWTPGEVGQAYPVLGTLGFLYLYACLAYADGMAYETNHAMELGISEQGILQILELAFMRAGPRAIHAARDGVRPVLLKNRSETPETIAAFPPTWRRQPELFDVGCQPDHPEFTPVEEEQVRAWYRRNRGGVPPGVQLLFDRRPGILKSYHLRLASAMRGPLPAQALAFVELHAAAGTANGTGIAAAIELARGLGLTADEVVEALGWGMLYGGPEVAAMASAPFLACFGEPAPAR